MFSKHDVKHAYAETRPDHDMTQFDQATNGEKVFIMDKIDDAVSNPKYASRSSAVPDYIPEHLKEKVRVKQSRIHKKGHGEIPKEAPNGKFGNLNRAQISVLQSLSPYTTVTRYRPQSCESLEGFKSEFKKVAILQLREEREEEDCFLLAYRLDEGGRFYVCFIVGKDFTSFYHFFYCCQCY